MTTLPPLTHTDSNTGDATDSTIHWFEPEILEIRPVAQPGDVEENSISSFLPSSLGKMDKQ